MIYLLNLLYTYLFNNRGAKVLCKTNTSLFAQKPVSQSFNITAIISLISRQFNAYYAFKSRSTVLCQSESQKVIVEQFDCVQMLTQATIRFFIN